ncbi:SGNH/GDSL hydrolase family protein [Pseudomonas syringae]|uniref:SGNH/GDSL hydrolase family protein n=1 Tax=Pseudomonas syringae TaxID=317 RepID=A0A9Q4A943_PSESX|nr:SGNH/GDSL hydrolase family protein [Pseudomonas syringae]MCF5469052.1 SGNH/GDSL hydrolase family protein [Pseudomonas syringae]MCF5471589.1 SGNH/GDSL hydrolase family protein [Pseudomonas syringae]MCF5482566.1 SGNH/GDSL hydrolase family protein [Pseudomonas syringae]MCF5489509.1 SGNH/GDSL hydrolase family protein [Pseudomonas syringae]MCF5494039.1 SGNH/GDSL hydrolase family protein [Pseudomonas syringae]
MTARMTLTPQMAEYEQKFTDSGDVRWLPYLMYFHPTEHRSPVVNTDLAGFRYSESLGTRYSVIDSGQSNGSVRLLAGSSTVFGIGASADSWTLSSRLTQNDSRGQRWINFGGRSFNSTQELLLFALNKHHLPKVDEIVLFSGFNNLGLARQPQEYRGEHGAFFNCHQFFDALAPARPASSAWSLSNLFGKAQEQEPPAPQSMQEQIDYAADLTLQHLDIWRALAADMGAKLTFILQPLAGWVRQTGSPEEQQLFAELDQAGNFTEMYGDILQTSVREAYARRLRACAQGMGVGFVDITPLLAEALGPHDWQFVDRIHFTDAGNDLVSKLILDVTR